MVIAQAEPRPLWESETRRVVADSPQIPPRTDIAIIGGGYTGLWTALYLKMLDSSLDITILEKNTIGFGASGRNGGWCSALLPSSLSFIAEVHGHQVAETMRQCAVDNLFEMKQALDQHSIHCDYALGGTLTVARNRPQVQRLAQLAKEETSFGATDSDIVLLDKTEVDSRLRVTDTHAALFTPNCAALHPRMLVNGLAQACLQIGVSIVEDIDVVSYTSGTVSTRHNGRPTDIRCNWVVRATEGYSSTFKQARRELIPLYSFMIATEPLSPKVWSDIGWHERETLNDSRNGVIYAQRTADGRIVFGGRGAPYHFANRIHDSQDIDDAVHGSLVSTLHEFFPATRDALITHRWGGPLGVPRDWRNFARVDHEKRLAVGGGYTGDGVALAHLTGRMLAHGVLRRDHPSLALPWFGHRGRSWEPEPLRWLAINALRKIVDSMDTTESRHDKPARLRRYVVETFLG